MNSSRTAWSDTASAVTALLTERRARTSELLRAVLMSPREKRYDAGDDVKGV